MCILRAIIYSIETIESSYTYTRVEWNEIYTDYVRSRKQYLPNIKISIYKMKRKQFTLAVGEKPQRESIFRSHGNGCKFENTKVIIRLSVRSSRTDCNKRTIDTIESIVIPQNHRFTIHRHVRISSSSCVRA